MHFALQGVKNFSFLYQKLNNFILSNIGVAETGNPQGPMTPSTPPASTLPNRRPSMLRLFNYRGSSSWMWRNPSPSPPFV